MNPHESEGGKEGDYNFLASCDIIQRARENNPIGLTGRRKSKKSKNAYAMFGHNLIITQLL